MKSAKFSIEQYAGIASGFLLLHNGADAQVVYTDLIPDLIFQYDGDFEYIDMNDDGVNDFGFLMSIGIHSALTTPGLNTSWYYRVAIWAGPAVIGPEIAGISDHDSSAGGTYYFPYALKSGKLIDNDLSFQAGGFQLMASKTAEIYYGSSYTILSVGDWNLQNGIWNNTNLDSTRYLGVRFKDQENCLHYGWIRCSVVDSVDKLIVMDFAYEAQCNTPILAGDTISYVGLNDVPDELPVSVYGFGKTIYIHLAVSTEAFIGIYDLNGNCILRQTATNNYSTVDMSPYPAGIYLVSIKNNGMEYDRKAIIE